jgi:hypothetical protein
MSNQVALNDDCASGDACRASCRHHRCFVHNCGHRNDAFSPSVWWRARQQWRNSNRSPRQLVHRRSICTQINAIAYATTLRGRRSPAIITYRIGGAHLRSVSMSYRPLAIAAAVAALSSMHIASAAAQSVYVAPGGVYIGAGAGPIYVTPPAPLNGSTAYVEPYAEGYGTAAYVGPGYDYGYGPRGYVAAGYGDQYGPGPYVAPGYGYGPRPYVAPRYGYGYGPGPVAPRYDYGYGHGPGHGYRSGPGPYVAPRYGYRSGPGPYVAPRYGYGYGPAAPVRRHYNGPPAAYAAAVPPRPHVAMPYRAGRCVGRHCY